MVKLDIRLNSEPVDALSALIHRDHSYTFGKKICEKLKELITRQHKRADYTSAIRNNYSGKYRC